MRNTEIKIPPDALEALQEISALTGLYISEAAYVAIMHTLEDVRRKEKEGRGNV
jgi:hypothetical protein